MLDNSDFTETDIPFEVPLPETPCLSVSYKRKLHNILELCTLEMVLYDSGGQERRAEGVGVGCLYGPESGTGLTH